MMSETNHLPAPGDPLSWGLSATLLGLRGATGFLGDLGHNFHKHRRVTVPAAGLSSFNLGIQNKWLGAKATAATT